jgi:hypothetical protein
LEPNETQSRRAFLERAGALGVLVLGGSLWPGGSAAAAKVRPTVAAWAASRPSLTGDFANPLYSVAADASARTTYIAKCDGMGAIQFAKSVDEGRTFTAFKGIAGIANASDVPLDRSLVVDEATKRIHLLYSVGVDDVNQPASLLYIHSDNGGASWSSPVTLDDGVGSTGLNHGSNRFIRVAMAAQNGVVHIGWSSISNSTFVTDGLFYVKSTNGGDSFSKPVQPFPGTVSPSRPDIAMVGNTVLLTWTDARYGSAYNGNPGEVFVGRSTNGGSTWTQKRLTFTAKVWGAGTTLRPVICAGSNGTVTIVWQDPNSAPVGGAGGVTGHDSPGTEDLYWIHSSNSGATWGRIGVLVHAAGVQGHAYIAQLGNVVACVWSDWRSSPHQLRVRISTNGGATFDASTQPMVSSADASAPRIVASKGFFQVYAAEGGNGVFHARLPYRSHY